MTSGAFHDKFNKLIIEQESGETRSLNFVGQKMKKNVSKIVGDLLKKFLPEHGLELYAVTFSKEGGDHYLRVFIEKTEEDEYIGTDECEQVSRFLSKKLDEVDPIKDNYFLEVSSPGMDRELLKREHFKRYIGEQVEVRLYEKIGGSKEHIGELVSENDEELIIKLNDKDDESKINFPREKVARVKLHPIF